MSLQWTAAIALMDKGCLPRPPLTLTKSLLVSYKEPTPPDQQLLVQVSRMCAVGGMRGGSICVHSMLTMRMCVGQVADRLGRGPDRTCNLRSMQHAWVHARARMLSAHA